MIVVADTSPILNLERIGHLNLLPEMVGKVIVQEAVFVELSIPGEIDYTAFEWLDV